MTGFDDRKKGFENKYAHEERLSFDVEARCCKLFGLWAAGKLGLESADAQTYALSVVEANLDEPGFDDVLNKVRKDFSEKTIQISDHMLLVELDKCLEEAKRQIMEKQK
jgi:hypothetical protein